MTFSGQQHLLFKTLKYAKTSLKINLTEVSRRRGRL